MKTKYTTIIISLLMVSITSYGQLKVDQYGRIGMGTNWPNPGYKCHMKGNLLLTTYPSYPFIEFQFKVGNGWPGAEIGSTVDKIAFWSTWTSYNKLYAQNYYSVSDSTLKSNITPLTNGLSKIMKLNVYSYQMSDNIISAKTGEKETNFARQYGFLSQEVENLFPDINITDNVKGVKLMDYNQIIPITVLAIKEQQLIIDSLKIELENLKKDIERVNTKTVLGFDDGLDSKNTILYQNKPNPFNERTIIEFEIKENNFKSASILVFNMNGTLIKSYPIYTVDDNQLTVNGSELKAGMYIYTLIVNNKEVDTKRMILLK